MPNAVTYAETKLGVHAIYQVATDARALLEQSLDELGAARAAKRESEYDLAEHEVELLTTQTLAHPEMSATAMKDHIKKVMWSDEPWLEVRRLIDLRTQQVEQAEADVRLAENDVRISCARMNELGGYLSFLGAVKEAETKHNQTDQTEQTGQTE